MTTPGRIGRYRVLGPLGQGAMGVVLRAHDPQLDREVAIKLIAMAMAAGHGDRQETSSRFAREARVAARLHHPNVVSIFDAGEYEEQLFLVMELVDGEPLSSKLARGEFPGTQEALEIVAQAADALAAAHQAGVIHRDIKPGNLMITRRKQVKVGDFGVARAMGESTELTRTGMMVGSPAYMAPEQVQGRQLDGRTDLFSLGVVLYEMLLRRKPFPADTLTTLVYQILHEDPFDSATVSQQLRPELAEFLRWALAKDPAHRVPDAVTFATRARALAAGLSGAPSAGTAPTTLLPAAGAELPPPSYATSAPTAILRRKKGLGWLPFAAAGLLLAGLATALLLRRPAPPPDTGASPAPRTEPAAQPLQVEALATPAPPPPRAEPEPAQAEPEEPIAKPVEPKPVAPAPKTVVPPAAPPVEPAQSAPAATVTESVPVPVPAPAPAAPEAPAIAKTFEGRKSVEFHVDPEETVVTIDGSVIGTADEWDGAGGGKAWVPPGPGEYTVRLALDGFRTVWVRVRITPNARREIAKVNTELDEIE